MRLWGCAGLGGAKLYPWGLGRKTPSMEMCGAGVGQNPIHGDVCGLGGKTPTVGMCGVGEASWCGGVCIWGRKDAGRGMGALRKIHLWGCMGLGGQNLTHGDVWGWGLQNPIRGDAQGFRGG